MHLKKSLYRLRQVPRYWFFKLTTALRKCGFSQSYEEDYSLFTYSRHHVLLCELIYVDDLLIIGNSQPTITKFKASLSACFHMKDLGPLKYFVGIEIARNPSGLFCVNAGTL